MADLIDRKAYRKTLRQKSADCEALSKSGSRRAPQYANMMLGINMAIMELDSAPAVEAEPVVNAEWILHPEIGLGEADKECSACGTMSLISSHRCHRCGAHMRMSYGPGQAEQEAPANGT